MEGTMILIAAVAVVIMICRLLQAMVYQWQVVAELRAIRDELDAREQERVD